MADLHELMREAAATGPRPDGLLAAAQRSGQRRLRRRRSAAAAGTAALVTTIAVSADVISHPATNRTAAPTATSLTTPTPRAASSAAASALPSSTTVPATSGVPVTTPAGQASTAPSTPGATVSPMSVAAPAALRNAPFYYSRELSEQYGRRIVVKSWLSQFDSPVANGGPADSTPEHPVVAVSDKVKMYYGQSITWSDFQTTPSAAQLHLWLYGTAAGSQRYFGKQIQGSVRSYVYAMDTGADLVQGTPATDAFRLSVLAALKQVPGVVVTPQVRDEIGRSGVELTLNAQSAGMGTLRDIFDPIDGTLLQSAIYTADGTCASGNLEWRAVFLEQGIVANVDTVITPLASPALGSPASCLEPGQQPPPPALATS
jgi:hypothetical protein